MNDGSNKGSIGGEVDLVTLTPALTLVEELKGTLFQYHTLYSSWVVDRQQAASQGAEMQGLIMRFKEQVDALGNLEPSMCKYIGQHIREATGSAVKSIGEEIGQKAVGATKYVTEQLASVVGKTEQTLRQYERETKVHQWQVIGISVFTTLVTCLLLVWLLIPKPTLPLSHKQINYLESGILMELVWPKLSKQEQDHWLKLADHIQHPTQSSNETSR